MISGTGVGRFDALLDRPPKSKDGYIISEQVVEILTVSCFALGRHGVDGLGYREVAERNRWQKSGVTVW